jgi:PKHD-type hydroxylase
MFLEVKGVLTPDEMDKLRKIAAEAPFVDGRITNPNNIAKVNEQADFQSPHFVESANLISAALMRTREFRDFVFPMKVAPPLLTRYRPDMKYGAHYDAAFMVAQGQSFRSDVSATVFINDPSSYEGGELSIRLGSKKLSFKGAAGSVVFYPSTTLHEVEPVRSGERLVAITFVQSNVPDEAKRTLLYELNEVGALEGLKMSHENRVRFEGARFNLLRMWSAD